MSHRRKVKNDDEKDGVLSPNENENPPATREDLLRKIKELEKKNKELEDQNRDLEEEVEILKEIHSTGKADYVKFVRG